MHTGQHLIAEPGSGARVAVALQARIECDDRGSARTGGRRGLVELHAFGDHRDGCRGRERGHHLGCLRSGHETVGRVACPQDLDGAEPLRLGLVDFRFEAGEPARALLPPFRVQIAEVHHHRHGRRQVQGVRNHAGGRDVGQLEWGRTRTVPDTRAKGGRAEIGDLRRGPGGEVRHAPQALPPVRHHGELEIVEILPQRRDSGERVRVVCRARQGEPMLPREMARELVQALVGEGAARRGQPWSEHQDIH